MWKPSGNGAVDKLKQGQQVQVEQVIASESVRPGGLVSRQTGEFVWDVKSPCRGEVGGKEIANTIKYYARNVI